MKQPALSHPILFKGRLVRKILQGKKTQTRRVIRAAPSYCARKHYPTPYNDEPEWVFKCKVADQIHGRVYKCPYGKPGDRLWVRESFSYHLYNDGIWYWADGNCADQDSTKPKPSIHMPRWASRIQLEVTKIRVERVNDITEVDAQAEGAVAKLEKDAPARECTARWKFMKTWDEINTKRGFGWFQDPWVWVVEFKILKGEA